MQRVNHLLKIHMLMRIYCRSMFVFFFCAHVRYLNMGCLTQHTESSWTTLKVVEEKVNWFLSSGSIQHEVSMVVFLDNCMLLPAALHFDSHFHSCFHEQQKYSFFFSRSLCANSTIRPAGTRSLERVLQKQQHFKILVSSQ